jgi:hypothetical protein
MVARAAQLGENGDVDGALEATKQADAIARQHDTLYKQLTEPERTMTVCEICGVFINSTDNDQRRLVSAAGAGRAFESWDCVMNKHAAETQQHREHLNT